MTLEPPPGGLPPESSLELAAERTVLACERTYSAWVRTGLSAVVAAVGLHAVLRGHVPRPLLHLSSAGLLAFGALCFVAAIARSRVGAGLVANSREMLDPRMAVAMNLLLFLGVMAAAAGLWSD
jgi:putative membrane protein